MTDILGDLVGDIKSLVSEQSKLHIELQALKSRLEEELAQEDKRFEKETEQLKKEALRCPPILVKLKKVSTIYSNDGDQSNQWISESCFYTHPLGYKLCLVLKSKMPRMVKPKLAIKIVALSQVDSDQHRTWPCKGEITLKIIDQRKCSSFTTKLCIEKPVDSQDSALSEVEGWVALPEDAVPFIGEQVHLSHGTLIPFTYTSNDFLINELRIRIEAISLDKASKLCRIHS